MSRPSDRRARTSQAAGPSLNWPGGKPCRTAAQLREQVLAEIRGLQVAEASMESPGGLSALDLGMPYVHPPDVLGRNWNIAEVRGLPSQHRAQVRLLIDRFREAFDLSDP